VITSLDAKILNYVIFLLQVLNFEPKQHSFHFPVFDFSVLIVSVNHRFKILCFINE
jgi:hypothetical protein